MEFCELFNETTSCQKTSVKPPVARKLAVGHMCPTASVLATGGFKFYLFQNVCMSVYKHAVVAAFCIYAQSSEDAAKRGGSRQCIK